MICKLCLKDKPLIKKSHIIPDFMYREIYDEDNRIVSYHFQQIKKIIRKSFKQVFLNQIFYVLTVITIY